MKVLLFGELTDIAGNNSIEIETSKDVVTLNDNILQKFPSLQNMKYRTAVNNSFINSNITLHESDVVALLPAFAGG